VHGLLVAVTANLTLITDGEKKARSRKAEETKNEDSKYMGNLLKAGLTHDGNYRRQK
jgi:hypothetical protein